MRARTLLWFNLIWLLVPLGLLAGELHLESIWPPDSFYPFAVQVKAFGSSVLVQPLTSLLSCLAGARLRRSQLLVSMPIDRSRLRVLLALLAPPALATFLVTLSLVSVASIRWSPTWVPDWRIVLVVMVTSLSYAALGMALGLAIRPILAAPAAVLLPYLLIAFPPAMSPYWMRHLTSLSEGFSVYETLAPRALIAYLLFSVTVLAAALAIFARALPGGRRPMLSGLSLAAVAGTSAIVVALPLGVSAYTARHGHPTCREFEASGRQLNLCLWPEHEAMRARGERIYRRVARIAASSGAEIPTTLTERLGETLHWPLTGVDLSPSREGGSDVHSIASALYPDGPCEAVNDTGRGNATDDADDGSDMKRSLLTLWWERELGAGATAERVDPETAAEFSHLTAKPRAQQVAWINAAVNERVRTCGGKG